MNEIITYTKTPNISLIYAETKTVLYMGQKYHRAFVVNENDKRGRNTAKWYFECQRCAKSDIRTIVLPNSNLHAQLILSADLQNRLDLNPTQYPCIITYDYLQATPDLHFIVALDIDMIGRTILNSTVKNGVIMETGYLARRNGCLGFIHEQMPEHQELEQTLLDKKKYKRNPAQTKDWEPGFVYRTQTKGDLMFGWFNNIAQYNTKTGILEINDDHPNRPIYYPIDPDFNHQLSEDELRTFIRKTVIDAHTIWPSNRYYDIIPAETCPNRTKSQKLFDATDAYFQMFSEQMEQNITQVIEHQATSIWEWFFLPFNFNPQSTLRMLKFLKNELKSNNASRISFQYKPIAVRIYDPKTTGQTPKHYKQYNDQYIDEVCDRLIGFVEDYIKNNSSSPANPQQNDSE